MGSTISKQIQERPTKFNQKQYEQNIQKSLKQLKLYKNSDLPAVLFIGETGTGKSSLINKLAGNQVAMAGVNAKGVTKNSKSYICQDKMQLVDSPGLGDYQVDFVSMLSKITTTIYGLNTYVLVFVLNSNNPRISKHQLVYMQLVRAVVKKDTGNYVICCNKQDKCQLNQQQRAQWVNQLRQFYKLSSTDRVVFESKYSKDSKLKPVLQQLIQKNKFQTLPIHEIIMNRKSYQLIIDRII